MDSVKQYTRYPCSNVTCHIAHQHNYKMVSKI